MLSVPTAASAAAADSSTAFTVFAPSFQENAATHTVSLPSYTGVSHGAAVTFVTTDASTQPAAERLGVNWSPLLGNAAGTAAPNTCPSPVRA